MKLASAKRAGSRDGSLVIVKRDLSGWTGAEDLSPTLQAALDKWDTVAPRLAARAQALEAGGAPVTTYDASKLHSPLPRAYEWVDASALRALRTSSTWFR
jgi:fumarylacetoacetate (FAA) hydrolase